tara:strand:- start:804 stop:1106 length:303 start_codon:yes stop_codon:yes gene_type:complete
MSNDNRNLHEQQNMIDEGWDVDCLNEHIRFRMEHLVGERKHQYDYKNDKESIWVRKNWYDCSGPGDDEIDSVIIDNKYEKKYYHTTTRNSEGKWVHIIQE